MSAEYLIIEPFLTDALQARALQAAFDLGIIDGIANTAECDVASVLKDRDCDLQGGIFLMQMLAKSGVLQVHQAMAAEWGHQTQVRLTDRFRKALPFRDLLTAKLAFSSMVATDYFEKMPQLLRSAADFMATAKLFELFDYGRCLEVTTANCMQASRWMQLTTMLTRYESAVCHQHYNFAKHRHMLDIGGNSGEFSVQLCRRTPELQATVLDLPVVCQVGQRHVQSQPEAARIRFQAGNMLQDSFPENCDLITWKSVLHDWPDDRIPLLLAKCFDALPNGGTLLIFERQSWDFSLEETPYGLLPVMLFFRSYRSPGQYQTFLEAAGLCDIRMQTIPLEVPFLLMTATKR